MPDRRVDRWVRMLFQAALVLALVVSFAPGARAACETGGMSGSGLAPGSDEPGSGSGGTGRANDSDSGSGGTGRSEATGGDEEPGSGSGGTGVLGVITGFGSVCINGAEIDYDAATQIEVDGRPAREQDLAIGQLVRITTRAGRPDWAQEIRVQHAVVGPIERASAAERAIWVMGQRIELRGANASGASDLDRSDRAAADGAAANGAEARLFDARGRELVAGTHVAVSGFRREPGTIVASRIDGLAPGSEASATAVVEAVGRGAVVVGGIRAELGTKVGASGGASESAREGAGEARREGARDGERSGPRSDAQSDPRDWSGQRVRVSGVWNAERGVLERAQIRDARSIAAGAERVSIQGFAERGAGDSLLRIEDVTIDARGVGSALAGVTERSRIRVEGVVEGGRVRAERLLVDERDASRGAAQAVDDAAGSRGRRERGDRSGRSGRSDRSGREERGDRGGRGDRGDRSDRSGRLDRSDR